MYSSLVCCVDEYQPWLASNAGKISKTDQHRFNAQLICVKKLIAEYESDSFQRSGPTEEHFQRLISMIADLQGLGEFPDELMAKINTQQFARNRSQKNADSGDSFEPPDCNVS